MVDGEGNAIDNQKTADYYRDFLKDHPRYKDNPIELEKTIEKVVVPTLKPVSEYSESDFLIELTRFSKENPNFFGKKTTERERLSFIKQVTIWNANKKQKTGEGKI